MNFYTIFPYSPTIVNTPNLHQGAFNRWMGKTEELRETKNIRHLSLSNTSLNGAFGWTASGHVLVHLKY